MSSLPSGTPSNTPAVTTPSMLRFLAQVVEAKAAKARAELLKTRVKFAMFEEKRREVFAFARDPLGQRRAEDPLWEEDRSARCTTSAEPSGDQWERMQYELHQQSVHSSRQPVPQARDCQFAYKRAA